MQNISILPIILNFNQPNEAEKIYNKLKNDGFEEIISVDNGSDKMPPANSANFLLPKNIKAVGQAKMALIYAMDYFAADYYWLINTSSELLDNINYKEKLFSSINQINKKNLDIGILSPALISDEVINHQKYREDSLKDYSLCCWCECIAPLISHNLLEITRTNETGYFEKNAHRGWVTTHEMGQEAVNNNLWWILDHKLPVIWNKNSGYKKNLGGEALNNYKNEASNEMKNILSKKYGRNWRIKLYVNFLKQTRKNTFPLKIIPYDPFGIWKIFFARLSKENLIKTPAYYCLIN